MSSQQFRAGALAASEKTSTQHYKLFYNCDKMSVACIKCTRKRRRRKFLLENLVELFSQNEIAKVLLANNSGRNLIKFIHLMAHPAHGKRVSFISVMKAALKIKHKKLISFEASHNESDLNKKKALKSFLPVRQIQLFSLDRIRL